jgi:prepilin-type N-terminal cleavage/methylation domain-containing protein
MNAESENVAPMLRVGKLRHAERGGYFGSSRSGLSLLEVMLAIAILGLALATMGELVRLGTQAAGETRDLTKAQLLCEGIASELAAGILPLEPAEETPYELDPEWTYSVSVAPLNEGGLLGVTVMVQKVIEQSERPVYFTLTRWMIDPLLEQVQDPETILGGDSESTATGATGETGETGDAAGGDPNAGGQNTGQNGGANLGGANFGGGDAGGNQRGRGGNDQAGPGGGGNRQGGGGQFGGGNRQGGGQFGGGNRQGGGGQFGGNRQGGGGGQSGGNRQGGGRGR